MKKIIFLLSFLSLPLSLSAMLMKTFDQPLQGLSSNSVIDIATHKNGVWLATGNGVSYTKDGGVNWSYFNESNGLISDELSAIYSDTVNGLLWLATNHPFVTGTDTFFYADGLSYTDNEGLDWNNTDTLIPGSFGGQSTIYDITGYDSLIFCASWAGGFFGTFDHGEHWRHIYYSLQDSISGYQSSRNLAFSAVLDTLHRDSIVLWAGSADGLMRYVYAPGYAKPSSNRISDVTSSDGFIYIAGDSGFTRLNFNPSGQEIYHSSFKTNGLPGMAVSTIYRFGGRIYAGTLDSLNGQGTGLAISDDNGLSFNTNYNGLNALIGTDKYPVDFASINNRLYMACLKGGLYGTSDSGRNWQRVFADSSDTTVDNGRNIIHSLAADSLNLLIGTDSGLVVLFMDTSGSLDSTHKIEFDENAFSGGRTYRVRIQKFLNAIGGTDSTAIWVVNHPLNSAVGNYAVYRSTDYGLTWSTNESYLVGLRFNDIAFSDSVIYLVGANDLTFSPNNVDWYPSPGQNIRDSLSPTISFNGLILSSIDIVNDTIFIGSERGLAISPSGSNNWHVVIANTDPHHQDQVNLYSIQSGQLTGNFVTALGIQYLPGGSRIWATTRPGASGGGDNGIVSATLDGNNWATKHTGTICWNYDFSGDGVFAATDAGLLFSANGGSSWDTLRIQGSLINFERPVPYSIGSGEAVYAAKVVKDSLWVGTSDGAAKIAISELGNPVWDIIRVYDPSQQTYAYPVPFSPYSGAPNITFHYPIPKDANVTLGVYDFSMNLVKEVISSQPHPGGSGIISSVDKWDGRNGKGEVVAAGIYYFKVELSTGEVYWGKLAIVP